MKGTENKTKLDGFECIVKPLCAVIFSTVRGSEFCSSKRWGRLAPDRKKILPSHLLTPYSQHSEREKKGGKKEIVGRNHPRSTVAGKADEICGEINLIYYWLIYVYIVNYWSRYKETNRK